MPCPGLLGCIGDAGVDVSAFLGVEASVVSTGLFLFPKTSFSSSRYEGLLLPCPGLLGCIGDAGVDVS
ncbi:hypothetical protein, partial [Providencia alcalifaciens]|uniref:hypothetical protein n=1 Tax=Providencia alcalifaciens TaxID=126385 RepID=UPI001E2B2235